MSKSNAFDLLGPIMVGPSSSHTAGAVRLGAMARKILNKEPERARILLHGSFAETGKGHGTHLALVAGLLGFKTDDIRISEALNIARERGLRVSFEAVNLGEVHPNTVRFLLYGADSESISVTGSSIGGGRIVIREINEFDVEIRGDYPTLVILNQDLPGVIAQVAALLATVPINIAQMRVSREKKGARALTVVETDQGIDSEVLAMMRKVPAIYQAMTIEPLE